MQTDLDKLASYLPQLSADQIAKLAKYYETLLHFNTKINLVSSSTAPLAAKHHFADSVLGLEIVLKQAPLSGDVYDFGSGNGFPGVILGVLNPDIQIFLVERDLRKSEFMKHVAAELSLKNMKVLSQSIESLPKNSVRLGTNRALGSIANVSIQTTSLFQPEGLLFHFKGDSWTSELANCPTQVFTKWDIQLAGQYTLPESTIERFVITGRRL